MNDYSQLNFGLGSLPLLSDAETRSISAENPTGERGNGAKAMPGRGKRWFHAGPGLKAGPASRSSRRPRRVWPTSRARVSSSTSGLRWIPGPIGTQFFGSIGMGRRLPRSRCPWVTFLQWPRLPALQRELAADCGQPLGRVLTAIGRCRSGSVHDSRSRTSMPARFTASSTRSRCPSRLCRWRRRPISRAGAAA